VEPIEVTHVVIGHEDVDELVQVAVLIEETIGKARVRGIQGGEHFCERGSFHLHGGSTS
jgi:hypothetical protein